MDFLALQSQKNSGSKIVPGFYEHAHNKFRGSSKDAHSAFNSQVAGAPPNYMQMPGFMFHPGFFMPFGGGMPQLDPSAYMKSLKKAEQKS
jgi:hypothetical protein